MIAGINEEEIDAIKKQRENTAKQLTIDYLFYIFADKEDITSYKKEILRKANMKKVKLDAFPEDMAKRTAKVLEDCLGDSNVDDFVAKLSLATSNGDVQKYKAKRDVSEVILDSLLDYNVLERKEARINARGTMKEIIEGRYKDEKQTAYDYQEDIKNKLLEDEKKNKEIETKSEKKSNNNTSAKVCIGETYNPVEKNINNKKSIEEIKEYSRLPLRISLAVLTSLALFTAYSERDSLKQTFNYLKNKADNGMTFVADKLFKDYDRREQEK